MPAAAASSHTTGFGYTGRVHRRRPPARARSLLLSATPNDHPEPAITVLPDALPPSFHLLAKPTGATCNLDCAYCFFLEKEQLYPDASARA